MLKRLRLQLALMYPLAGLALILLFGGGSYLLIRYYLQTEYYPDIELEARMAAEFDRLGIPLPEKLQNAQQTLARHQAADRSGYRTDESLLFVLALDSKGLLLTPPDQFQPEARGVAAAQIRGRDLRTYRLADGAMVRFLTCKLPPEAAPVAYLQIGRWLTTKDVLIDQLSMWVIVLGVLGAMAIALFSWRLAGRSLLPTQRAWDQQQKFIANASHELRAPLTLIRASAEVALRPATREARRLELLGNIVQECDHVGRLVEELLLLSRLDAGRLTLARDPVPVDELFTEVCEQFSSLAELRGIALSADPGAGTVVGDRTRLRQILTILVDNAIKFTPPGGAIRLESRVTGKRVTMIVKDNGIGIAAQHLPHVFDRFYQVDAPERDSENGTGLGLSIARALVQAQNGSIRIDSQVGHGVAVTVWLPGT